MSIYTLGIDVGSTASKCIILKDGAEIVARSLVDVGTGTTGPQRAIEAVLAEAGMTKEDLDFTLATGYGRNSLAGIADKQMSELSCHAKGACFLFPNVHTVIDIGGQDVKVLHIENGAMVNFQMNDKCAAGTGRFLDVMSRVLEIPLGEMGEAHFKAKEWASVSSTCTVFAESEVISQLSKGLSRESIVAGVHKSVATKACSLVRRCGDIVNDVVMCGGVAQNPGAVDAIEKELGQNIIVAPNPQITGALGAALLAYEELIK